VTSKAALKEAENALSRRTDAWIDLALTLPVFVVYHLGVVFLPVRNAADPVTHQLQRLANHSLLLYAGLTLAIGATFVGILALLGREQKFRLWRFGVAAVEGTLYATLMRAAAVYVVGSLRLAPGGAPGGLFAAVMMSLGAGLYEEIAFRVGVYGLGTLAVRHYVEPGLKRFGLLVGWALVEALIFSGWHYVGPMSDAFDLGSFTFRAVCGLMLTLVFALRGFAPAVWTHALYDIWAMALR
jgi:hypothetical protein